MGDYLKLADHKNKPEDYQRAKRLRQQAPPAEQILWHKLRSFPPDIHIKFRRQHPLHPYIADFICLKAKLIVELDGPSHEARQQHDKKRDVYLKNLGYTVLRFGNDEVVKNSDGVAVTVLNKAKELMAELDVPLPQPLPQGEGSSGSSRG